MTKRSAILVFIVLFNLTAFAQHNDSSVKISDTLLLTGQVSGWGHLNVTHELPVWLGARAIPQVNYKIFAPNERLLDFEASANIYGSSGIKPFDSIYTDGDMKLYRFWGRYSTQQTELRVGLQKINFGSASMLRPLMWFEQIDARDPLQLTNGVWGALGRYYFLNNANLWMWCLYGNKEPRPWDIGNSETNKPEIGGRIQSPVPKGEMALSYHHRYIHPNYNGIDIPLWKNLEESRIGIDGKFDVAIGLWFEAAWIAKHKNIGLATHQEMLTIGGDYTFGIGNGVNMIYEQFFVATDEKAFALSSGTTFSAISLSYPLGLFDNVSFMSYFDWKNNSSYNFINWKHQLKYLSLHLMAYSNPTIYNLPQQGDNGFLFAGNGLQIMCVYNF